MDAPLINSAATVSAYQADSSNIVGGPTAENSDQLQHHHPHHLYKHHQIIGGSSNQNSTTDQYVGQQIFHMQYNLVPAPNGLLVSNDLNANANNSGQSHIISGPIVSNNNSNGSNNVISINRSNVASFADQQRSISKIDIDFTQRQQYNGTDYYDGQDQSRHRHYMTLKNNDQESTDQHQSQVVGKKFDHNGLVSIKSYADSNGRLSSESGQSSVDENCPTKHSFDYFPLSENELEQISVRDLNKLLQGQDRDIISKVKAKRRTLKNRGYALKCRSRRIEIQTQLMTENKTLKMEISSLKQQLGNWHEAKKELYFLRTEVARLRGKLQQVCVDKAVFNCPANQHVAYYGGNPIQNIVGNGEEAANLGPLSFSATFNARCLMPVPASFCLSPGSVNISNNSNTDNDDNYSNKNNVIMRNNCSDNHSNVITIHSNDNGINSKSDKPTIENQWSELDHQEMDVSMSST